MSIDKKLPNHLKHQDFNFTTIINHSLDMIKDAGALGVYVYLLSKPEDWKIQKTDIGNRFGKGEDWVTARLKNLKKIGLVKTHPIRDEAGMILYWETVLFKYLPELSTDESRMGVFQNVENPESGKHPPLNKERSINKERNINKRDCSSSDEPEINDDFDQFWDIYPRKVGKKNAMIAWKKLNQKEKLIILTDVSNRIKNDQQWQELKFTPYPATYLQGKRWEDEIMVSKPISSSLSAQNRQSIVPTGYADSTRISTVREWGPGHPDYDRQRTWPSNAQPATPRIDVPDLTPFEPAKPIKIEVPRFKEPDPADNLRALQEMAKRLGKTVNHQ